MRRRWRRSPTGEARAAGVEGGKPAPRTTRGSAATQAAHTAACRGPLAAIPDGSAKSGGIATGQAAAAQMIALRLNDGSSPPQFYLPTSIDPGVWQLTASCPAAGGVAFQWQNMTPFGVRSVPGSQAWIAQFAPGPPPALTSKR